MIKTGRDLVFFFYKLPETIGITMLVFKIE